MGTLMGTLKDNSRWKWKEWKECNKCSGKGQIKCLNCGGTGKRQYGIDSYNCAQCGGSGTVTCRVCGGGGRVAIAG